MPIATGEQLPNATLQRKGDAGTEQVDLYSIVSGKRVAIFGLPGAFTGTCSTAHVPSFMRNMDALRAKGIDEVICIAVNDADVMRAWGKATGATESGILMLADPLSEFTKAIGMAFSAPAVGYVDRCARFTMFVDDGVVKVFNPEPTRGQCTLSSAETLLEQI